MRISDCADLAGTTVRTIRYYHQVGLLPVPGTVAGRRDYGLEHLARVLRIRWLADAGLPLDAIATLLAQDDGRVPGPQVAAPGLQDLQATASAIDERIAELQAQRERVGALLDMAASGRGLRALPPGIDRFYDHLARTVTDPATMDVLRREQRMAELFAQRGLVPASFDRLVTRLTDDDLAVIVDFYTGYAHLSRLAPHGAEVEVDRLVHAMTTWCTDNADLTGAFVAALPRWAREPVALRSLVRLSSLFAFDRRQAQVMHRLIPVVTDLLAPAPDTAAPQTPAPQTPAPTKTTPPKEPR